VMEAWCSMSPEAQSLKVFICYSGEHTAFVAAVVAHLKRHMDEIFFAPEHTHEEGSFQERIEDAINQASDIIIFQGKRAPEPGTPWKPDPDSNRSHGQKYETDKVKRMRQQGGGPRPHSAYLEMDGRDELVVSCRKEGGIAPETEVFVACLDAGEAERCARQLIERTFGKQWVSWDDLPTDSHLFDYEKDIIEFYAYL